MKGKLFIVATPIGNLSDITFRAIECLKTSDLILCENSRNSQKLLSYYEIQTPSQDLHKVKNFLHYNWIINILESGKNISYISDAGTPGISDPGAALVRHVRQKGIIVVPIPGASALSSILSVAGAKTNPTHFLGFLSEKAHKKELELQQYVTQECLVVFYESVHKIEKTLLLVRKLFPEAEIVIGRELTKLHEEIIVWYPNQEFPNFEKRGEFVILINNYFKKIAKEEKFTTDI